MTTPSPAIRRLPRRQVALWILLAGSLSVAVTSLVWLAYRAVGEWQRSAVLLVEQRSEEALTLLTVALSRDMKGAHNSVLASFDESALNLDRPYDLADLFAEAFARFPYPESFFVWRDAPGPDGSTIVFNRVDRRPAWSTGPTVVGGYPVVSLRDTAVGRTLSDASKMLVQSGARFGAFDTTLSGVRCQVVVRLLYHTTGERRLFGLVGFVVNVPWVEHNYFQEILRQISAIGNIEGSLALTVANTSGAVVASTGTGLLGQAVLHARRFPFSFLDPDLVPNQPSEGSSAVPEWTASVSADNDRTLAAVSRGTSRTLWLIVIAGSVALLGVALALGALKRGAELAEMQSEFMASATHELKTPLALFQLVADTLGKGRHISEDKLQSYGGMLSDQLHILERLIDNLLVYASLSHVTRRYHYQVVSVAELAESALERFDARLAARGTDVRVDVPPSLAPVRVDRQRMLQVFDNLIDNALKYSPPSEPLRIRGYESHNGVVVEITDHGVGIPQAERQKVFEKFYRVEGTNVSGSGLGLSIAQRVILDHGGQIEIVSADPCGTTLRLTLPLASTRLAGSRAASA